MGDPIMHAIDCIYASNSLTSDEKRALSLIVLEAGRGTISTVYPVREVVFGNYISQEVLNRLLAMQYLTISDDGYLPDMTKITENTC